MSRIDLSGQVLSLNILMDLLEPVKDNLKELNLSKCSLDNNEKEKVLEWIETLSNLKKLDLSESFYYQASESFRFPSCLEELNLKGNRLIQFPLEIFKTLNTLKVLNLSGNELENIPEEIERLEQLEQLYLGGNKIQNLPFNLGQLKNLKVLYLGGNRLEEIPISIGNLEQLSCLSLHDNLIKQLPHTMVKLSNLQVLNIHKNQIKVLPVEIIGLRHLKQLSVRENPLVTNFAQTIHMGVASLLELSARAVKKHKIDYSQSGLPHNIHSLLQDAKCCVGCGGTYFGQVGVSQVEFVDLCGSFRVPFLRYICSKNCFLDQATTSPSVLTQVQQIARVRKVLLDKYNPTLSASVEILQSEIEQNEIDDLF